MVDQSPTSTTIGARIRGKRQEEGISIRELARRTGFTASFISQVENEKANVSLESLRRIAEALGVSKLYFLSEFEPPVPIAFEEPPAPAVERMQDAPPPFDRTRPLIKGNMRARLFLPDSGITYELLTSRLDHKMEAFMGRMAPGAGNVAARLQIPTEEFIYCLSGTLKVGIRDQVYLLEPGDSIYFDGPTLTCLASGSETEESVWLSVITPPAF